MILLSLKIRTGTYIHHSYSDVVPKKDDYIMYGMTEYLIDKVTYVIEDVTQDKLIGGEKKVVTKAILKVR